MKLFTVRFTTGDEMTPFGEVPGILEASGLQGLILSFISGGWNKGETDICYHEWKSEENPELIKKFFETRYGQYLVEICIQEKTDTPGSLTSHENFPPYGNFPDANDIR
jgi:hypothetical protein